MLNPNKVIVYRSQAEAISDDFWWSDGVFAATKAGDAICMAILCLIVVFSALVLYDQIFGRYTINGILFLLSTTGISWFGYLIIKAW